MVKYECADCLDVVNGKDAICASRNGMYFCKKCFEKQKLKK